MTTKLEQAARQALEALEVSTDWDVGAKGKQLQSMKAITALREALDHSADAGNMVPDHIAASGKVILTTEQAQQIEEAFDKARIGLRDWELPENRYAALNAINPALATIRAARAQEQEPVAIADGTFNHNCPLGTPLYTAPVRTKDLTDYEIADVFRAIHMKESWSLDFARAVIAADRRNNK